MERTEQIEQCAQKLWAHRSSNFIKRVEKESGNANGELNPHNAGSWGLEWGQLPDKTKDHIREMAAKEVEAMSVQQTEAEQYLITLLRELDRLQPAATWAVSSHGLIWDKTWERQFCSSTSATPSAFAHSIPVR
jgi:hypothetical protein